MDEPPVNIFLACCKSSSLPEFETGLPEIETGLLKIETGLPETKTGLLQINTSLHLGHNCQLSRFLAGRSRFQAGQS